MSVKNHADPYPQIMIWPKLINFHKNPLKTIKISLKTIKFHLFCSIRELFAVFKLRSIFDAILVPNWFDFGRILDVLGDLGASWGILGASWDRLGASWPRLGAS